MNNDTCAHTPFPFITTTTEATKRMEQIRETIKKSTTITPEELEFLNKSLKDTIAVINEKMIEAGGPTLTFRFIRGELSETLEITKIMGTVELDHIVAKRDIEPFGLKTNLEILEFYIKKEKKFTYKY
jgi:hypothetical protein